MSGTTDHVEEAETLVSWVKDRAVILFLVAIVLLTLAAELHVLSVHEHPFVLLTVIGGMIYFLRHDVVAAHRDLTKALDARIVGMQEVAQRVERTQAAIEGDVRQQSANVESLREALRGAGELKSLELAMKDLAPRFEVVAPGEEVEIDHLGLNMSAAWERLCPVIEQLVMTSKARVRFRLLILGEGGAGALGAGEQARTALPAAVEDWLKSGDTHRPGIERALKEIQDEALAAGEEAGSLDYAIRSYRDLPVVHGIRIRGSTDAAYVAFCRWDDTKREKDKYWWGGDQYHRILGPADPAETDLCRILDGHFHWWWTKNEAPDGVRPDKTRAVKSP